VLSNVTSSKDDSGELCSVPSVGVSQEKNKLAATEVRSIDLKFIVECFFGLKQR
jgi:hypothetical protein